MCHVSVSHVKRTTIRELKHETSAVLRRVAAGETVEVCRRNEPVAILSPPTRRARVVRPDFAARLRRIYGNKALPTTGSDLVSEARGDT
jgi:prevent-host-death family protein